MVISEGQSSDLSSARLREGTPDERHDCPFMAWGRHHNCAGHAAADLYIGWNDIDVDAHGNTLREPNPFEGRVYIREQLRTVRVVAVGDAAADAVNVPFERWSAAHQVDREYDLVFPCVIQKAVLNILSRFFHAIPQNPKREK